MNKIYIAVLILIQSIFVFSQEQIEMLVDTTYFSLKDAHKNQLTVYSLNLPVKDLKNYRILSNILKI